MKDNLVVAVRGTGVAAAYCQALLGAAGVSKSKWKWRIARACRR